MSREPGADGNAGDPRGSRLTIGYAVVMNPGIAHEHNLRQPPPAARPFGIRVSLRPSDPFVRLVGADWHKLHWYASEAARDAALAEMSRRYPFFRVGDEPTLVFEKVAASTPATVHAPDR